jgi:gliding motility-associated-like protein
MAIDDSRGTIIDSAVIVDVLTNDSGLEDGGLVLTTTTLPTNGTVLVNTDNTITYTPASGYLGTDSFDYRICDVNGDCDTATVTIYVKVTNDIPVAVNDTVSTPMSTELLINVLQNDSGLTDGVGNVLIYKQPVNGTVSINADFTLNYTPYSWYIGNDSFEYKVSDTEGDYSIAEVYVNITSLQNHLPMAVDDFRGTIINSSVFVDVLINDTGLEDGGLILTALTDPANGSVIINSGNIIIYTPVSDFIGFDSFDYQVCDKDGDCSTATVTINVKETNAIPVAINDSATTIMNEWVNINVLNNDMGLEDGIAGITIYTKPTNGTVFVNSDNTVTYQPYDWYVGIDSFVYVVTDVDGDYGMANVTINIESKPDYIPLAVDDNQATSINTPVNINVLFNDSGLEDGGLTVIASTTPTSGSVFVNSDNTITYTPNVDYIGYDSFNYQVCDIDGDCAIASVTINVKEINSIPVAVNDTAITFMSTSVIVNVLSNDTGLEDGLFGLAIASNPVNGTIVINADKTVTYTPANWYIGFDEFSYTLIDMDGDYSVAKVLIDIRNTNIAPEATNDNYTVNEGETLTVEAPGILLNDIDVEGKQLVSTLVSTVTNGELILNSDGSFVYTHNGTQNYTDSFIYKISDGQNESNEATVFININKLNTDPETSDDNLFITEGEISVTGYLLANDTDVDADELTILKVGGNTDYSQFILGLYGNLKWKEDGECVYYLDSLSDVVIDLNEGESLTESFLYTVTDSNGGESESKLTVTIYGIDNLDPIVISTGFSPNGDGVNDEFVIQNIEKYPGNELIVYNRWGTKVYSKENYENTWTGKSTKTNAVLPVGTYFYVLILKDEKHPIKGYVYLKY